MKKLLMLLGVAMMMVSCVTTTKTAKTADSSAQLLSATVAGLEISPERITYTCCPFPLCKKETVYLNILIKNNLSVIETDFSVAFFLC